MIPVSDVSFWYCCMAVVATRRRAAIVPAVAASVHFLCAWNAFSLCCSSFLSKPRFS